MGVYCSARGKGQKESFADEDNGVRSQGSTKKNERRYRIDWLRGTAHGHVSLVPYPDRMTCSWFA